jgi:50S ribosomal subunit-associated GTPase HflX
MTETILHGYQIILLPRKTGAHEVVISAPGAGDKRYDEHRLKWRIRQLEQELEAMRVAQDMLVTMSAVNNTPLQISNAPL